MLSLVRSFRCSTVCRGFSTVNQEVLFFVGYPVSPQSQVLKKSIERCRSMGVIIPTLSQLIDPSKIPDSIVQRLKTVGLWDINPVNLFRITWKNEPADFGGGFSQVANHLVLPPSLTGVNAKIVAMVGKVLTTLAPIYFFSIFQQEHTKWEQHLFHWLTT